MTTTTTKRTRPELQGKRVLVVGAARSGLAIAGFCAAQGAEVTLTDKKPADALGVTLPAGVRLEAGGHVAASFAAAEIIVLSPGVPPRTLPEAQAAAARGAWVTGETELAARFIDPAADFIGITGTNGKSTTTALAGAIAALTGRPTFTGGNLGEPLTTCLGTPAAARGGIVVCELSSYQLETADELHPRAAALLNVTPDHLDRYVDMAAYAAAKGRVFLRQNALDWAIYNADDPACEPEARRGGGIPYPFSSAPGRELPRGAFLVPGARGRDLVLRWTDGAGASHEHVMAEHDLPLVGTHNLENIMAAALCVLAVGATPAHIDAGTAAFRPLPHRMELVGEVGDVRYYDDSKGTNVGAVVKALDGFPRPVVLIAGGRDKGGDYGPMRDALAPIARAAVLIGEATDKIAASLAGAAYPIERAASMEDAVRAAQRLARPGDAVVLSPACSSFDMFKNFEHRGQVFRLAVRSLPESKSPA